MDDIGSGLYFCLRLEKNKIAMHLQPFGCICIAIGLFPGHLVVPVLLPPPFFEPYIWTQNKRKKPSRLG